ncbi:helix-turn-helix domain-containing protein [Myroides guanonis]|uniref:Helix-turn-helix domain-containing protein n=1 Tax=Myroides guanonis TaxID=1150112 RepID=A0A1I3PL28_9FLAO|nr:helix-turn-helix transcriptional regulator [Myroides guanonis]SFJ22183.1 Helix-turn-helix domain-containing protein [Myroides guanonis]
MTIGETIKINRLEKDISQKDLAKKIGVDVSFLCKVEKNEKKLSLDKLELISEMLSLELNELKYLYYLEKVTASFVNEKDAFIVEILEKIIKSYHV